MGGLRKDRVHGSYGDTFAHRNTEAHVHAETHRNTEAHGDAFAYA